MCLPVRLHVCQELLLPRKLSAGMHSHSVLLCSRSSGVPLRMGDSCLVQLTKTWSTATPLPQPFPQVSIL